MTKIKIYLLSAELIIGLIKIKKPIRATNQLSEDKLDSDSKYEDILNFMILVVAFSLLIKNKIINSITAHLRKEIPSIILPIMNKNTVTHLKYNSVVKFSSSGLFIFLYKSPLSWLNYLKKIYKILIFLIISLKNIFQNYASLVQINYWWM